MTGHVLVPTDFFGIGPSALWCAALAFGLFQAVRLARVRGLDERIAYLSAAAAIAGGLVIAQGPGLLATPMSLAGWFDSAAGAKSFYVGTAGGAALAAFVLRLAGRPIAAYFDVFVPALLAAYAVGRVGCFVNGDDFGTLTNIPWAVVYPPGSEPYAAHLANGWISSASAASRAIHPVQLYSAIAALAIRCAPAIRRPRRPGDALVAFAIGYGLCRLGIETFRADTMAASGVLSVAQSFSVALAGAGLAAWVARSRQHGPECAPVPLSPVWR